MGIALTLSTAESREFHAADSLVRLERMEPQPILSNERTWVWPEDTANPLLSWSNLHFPALLPLPRGCIGAPHALGSVVAVKEPWRVESIFFHSVAPHGVWLLFPGEGQSEVQRFDATDEQAEWADEIRKNTNARKWCAAEHQPDWAVRSHARLESVQAIQENGVWWWREEWRKVEEK